MGFSGAVVVVGVALSAVDRLAGTISNLAPSWVNGRFWVICVGVGLWVNGYSGGSVCWVWSCRIGYIIGGWSVGFRVVSRSDVCSVGRRVARVGAGGEQRSGFVAVACWRGLLWMRERVGVWALRVAVRVGWGTGPLGGWIVSVSTMCVGVSGRAIEFVYVIRAVLVSMSDSVACFAVRVAWC